MSYVDVLIVEERINHGLCFGKQYYYFGKHLGPFGKLRYFVAEANQTRDIWVYINHSYTINNGSWSSWLSAISVERFAQGGKTGAFKKR